MKKLLLSVLAFTLSLSSWAQSVSGTVLDHEATALPFANVLLLAQTDSSLAKVVTTDLDGNFLLEELTKGAYFLKISSVGFTDFSSPTFKISEATPTLKLQPIKLKQTETALDEVTVTAKKPFIEQQLDRTVVNVEGSIVGSGSTALEVLEKAPGVVVDRQNDQLKLKNKDGVLVMIDGRRSYLSQEALFQMLENMSSDQLTSIELITNPSSKYDASGNSGIINIKLKKNKNFGTNGTISVSSGTAFLPNSINDLYRGSTNLSLNHRNQKWNVFGNANVGRNANYNDNTLMRSTNFEGLRSEFDQTGQRSGNGIWTSGRIGADYFLSDKTTLGVLFDANNYNGTGVSTGLTNIIEIQGDTQTGNSLIPDATNSTNNSNFTGNFNVKHDFNEKGKEVTFDLDYSGYRNKGQQDFDTKYYNDQNNLISQLIQRNNTPTNIDIFASKIDFVIPTDSKVKIEFGAKTGYVQTDNDFRFEVASDGQWNTDAGKTNHFKYKEFVNAAYFNVGRQWDKVGVQGGLRAEHTKSQGNSITLNKVVDSKYLSLFPTLFINQKINDNNSLRYSYSRRIGRPNYQQLNPFLYFLDPYTFQKGNEFLRPQFTDNIELAYSFKSKINLSLGYAYTRDNMIDVIQQEDQSRVTFQTNINIESLKNYSANLSFPVSVTKWWNMHNNFSLYYNQFEDGNLSGGVLDTGGFAYNFYTGSTFSFKKGWSAEANMWFNSRQIMGIIQTSKPMYALNAGIQKSLFDKKAKVKLNVNDIFLTSFFEGDIDYENVDLSITNRWTSRRANLTFTYNFGNQNVKNSRKRSTATDDLKKRASK